MLPTAEECFKQGAKNRHADPLKAESVYVVAAGKELHAVSLRQAFSVV